MNAEDSLQRAEQLMERLEQQRARLEGTTDPETAIEVLTELAEIAKEVETALSDAKRQTDAET